MRIRTTATDVPQSIKTEEERMDILRGMHERLKIEGFYDPKTGLLIKPVPLSWGKGLPPTDSIQRAEEAFWWAATYLDDIGARIAVMTYVAFKASRRQGFPRIVCQRLARAGVTIPHIRAAYRLKDEGLGDIAEGLNLSRVPVVLEEAA